MVTNRMSDYGRIVFYDAANGVAVTWNGSATFNVWRQCSDGWENVDVFTSYRAESVVQAQAVAFDWMSLALEDEPVPAGFAESGMGDGS